jgi:hypothetical protein
MYVSLSLSQVLFVVVMEHSHVRASSPSIIINIIITACTMYVYVVYGHNANPGCRVCVHSFEDTYTMYILTLPYSIMAFKLY